MEEINAKGQMAKIRNFEKGFIASHLINIGAKLGVFQALNEEKEGTSISDLASKLCIHEPYLKVWLQTAYHFGIVDCDNLSRFRLQPFFDEILGDKSHFKNYLGNFALTVDHVGKMFDEYPEYFRTGETVENPYTPELSQAAYEATKNIYLAFFFMVFPKNDHLKQVLGEGIKVLDIGCGKGDLITQLAKAFGKSTFVGVDPNSHGIEKAKVAITKLGMEKQVVVENIGGENLLYDNEFDMATMVVTLHEIPPDVRMRVLEKAYQALKGDGLLLILDFLYPSKLEDFRNPMYDYGILDQFFETCAGFIHLSAPECDEMLTKAGFRNIQRRAIGKGMFELVTASK